MDVPRHHEFGAQAQLPLDAEHAGGRVLVAGGDEAGFVGGADVGVEADDAALVDVVHRVDVGDLGARLGALQGIAQLVDGGDVGFVAAAQELFVD